MDRFKFRYWDGYSFRYLENVWDFEYLGAGDHTGGPNKSLSELNLMQSTGLFDMHQNLIFEGDIIQMDYKDYKAKVVFWQRPPEYGFKPLDEDKWIEDWNLCDDSSKGEIIGNKWEKTPLKKSKK